MLHTGTAFEIVAAFTSVTKVAVFSSFEIATSLTFVIKRASFSALSSFGKANGKQKEYEERTKAKKKAEIEARKQAIRTEDIARGVFIPVSSLPQLGPRKGA